MDYHYVYEVTHSFSLVVSHDVPWQNPRLLYLLNSTLLHDSIISSVAPVLNLSL